jgi:hypothetical protein
MVVAKLYWSRFKSLLGLSSNETSPEDSETD